MRLQTACRIINSAIILVEEVLTKRDTDTRLRWDLSIGCSGIRSFKVTNERINQSKTVVDLLSEHEEFKKELSSRDTNLQELRLEGSLMAWRDIVTTQLTVSNFFLPKIHWCISESPSSSSPEDAPKIRSKRFWFQNPVCLSSYINSRSTPLSLFCLWDIALEPPIKLRCSVLFAELAPDIVDPGESALRSPTTPFPAFPANRANLLCRCLSIALFAL